MPDKVSIHRCLLFAEEFLKVGRLQKTGDKLLDGLGCRQYSVLKSAIQPAEVEFLGRELNREEREFLIEGVTQTMRPSEFGNECAAFEIAHIVYHCVNPHDNEH